MVYLSKAEQRRIVALVRKRTDVDCPTLEVAMIGKRYT
jgi:hypothetical protein